MKLGFLTVCLGSMSLKEKVKWAADNGFEALEVACWPKSNDRDYSSCDIDVETLTKEKAKEIMTLFKEHNLIISSLAYYDNNLDKDLDRRKHVNSHLKKVIDAANMLKVPYVGTFVGRNIDKSIADNFTDFTPLFNEFIEYANKKDVKLMIENCDMRGWQKENEPGTISYSPELWREMFKKVPSKNFGLNYDPSHLVLMLMDYMTPIQEFKDRIFHVHAKDAKIRKDSLEKYGVFDVKLDKDAKSYRDAKMPGLGDVDWKNFIEKLKSFGYDYVISIEHEDIEYSKSLKKIKEGLLIAKKSIEDYLK